MYVWRCSRCIHVHIYMCIYVLHGAHVKVFSQVYVRGSRRDRGKEKKKLREKTYKTCTGVHLQRARVRASVCGLADCMCLYR